MEVGMPEMVAVVRGEAALDRGAVVLVVLVATDVGVEEVRGSADGMDSEAPAEPREAPVVGGAEEGVTTVAAVLAKVEVAPAGLEAVAARERDAKEVAERDLAAVLRVARVAVATATAVRAAVARVLELMVAEEVVAAAVT